MSTELTGEPDSARPPLWQVLMYFELPFDTRLPDGFSLDMVLSEAPMAGWEDVPHPSAANAIQGIRESVGLTLCRSFDRVRAPGFHTSRAYRREIARVFRYPRLRRLVRLRPRAYRGRPMAQSVTAVRVSRLTARNDDGADQDWLSDRFDEALERLNVLLIATAIATGDVRIHPVERQHLEPLIPCAIRGLALAHGDTAGSQIVTLQLHHRVPVAEQPVDDETISTVVRLAAASHAGQQPWLLPGERLEAARRGLHSGRPQSAVLDAGTAAELLVRTTLRLAGPLLNPAGDWQRRSSAKFRQCFEHALPELLDLSADLEDQAAPLGGWYVNAYRLRNQVAHEGKNPGFSGAEQALNATHRLVAAIGEALKANDATRELGEQLVGSD